MSEAISTSSWLDANQRYLTAALAEIAARLEVHAQRNSGAGATAQEFSEKLAPVAEAARDAHRGLPASAALETIVSLFGLSTFERALLLLCAGFELDAAFAGRCAAAQGDPARAHPTFSLALAALPEPHWSALTPGAPLRHWRLVEVGAGAALTTSPLRIDERILHFLTGVNQLDERVAAMVEPLPPATSLAPSQATIVRRIAACWMARTAARRTVIQLCGADRADRRAIAATAGAALQCDAFALAASSLPAAGADGDAWLRLWEREAALGGSILLLECDDLEAGDVARSLALRRFIERARGPLLISTREPRNEIQCPLITAEVRKPSAPEQRALWVGELGAAAAQLDGRLDRIVAQFNLGTTTLRAAARTGRAECEPNAPDPEQLTGALWAACRAQSRSRLDDLAQRIDSTARWEDLVLPERPLLILRELVRQLRHRTTVYHAWGFAARSARGLGLSALFTGPSGTGKTLAAEVLAAELELDLYRIDLSQVVSKYIGETEKNLRRVFDAADDGGAVLLFDEADALFGKRSEVKDSHDRYANIEVSYLLQRMEAYRGLAILTTNLKDALDAAFLRRLRFIVPFTFPDATQRAAIWRRVFPVQTPVEGLDPERLARLNLAGGNIRNVALNAAFLAAGAGTPVGMQHIVQAARSEYGKMEKPLTTSEIEALL